MYLFGGKFCKFVDESGQERECTCPEIVSKHPLCECDRKHFNNFLWATVTVFQVSRSKSISYNVSSFSFLCYPMCEACSEYWQVMCCSFILVLDRNKSN